MRRRRLLLALLPVAVLAAGCGDGDDEPRTVSVPLSCAQTLDRLERRAARWPDPASLEDLRDVNADLLAAVGALGPDCADADFRSVDTIECAYLAAVTPADDAARLFLASQQARCADDPVPEADPDDPVATTGEDGTGVP